jgi:uncharacterized membrane protein YeaQ/YmgE (transglycosylase-associated protein family)
MRLDPTVLFVLVILIGVVAGLVFDRFAGPGWLTRQFAGARRGLVTSALVGVAGSFIGFHVVALLRLGVGIPQLVGAAVGALLVLWLWRVVR